MKKNVLLCLLSLSMVLFFIVKTQTAYAGELSWPNGPTGPSGIGTLANNNSVTVVNDSGKILSGPSIYQSEIVPIVYYGTDIKADTVGYNWTSNNWQYVDTPITIKNVAYYKGNYLNLRMKIGAFYLLHNVNGGIVPDQAGNLYPSSTEYEIWLEDLNGNEIKDENVQFVLPTNLSIPKATGTQYRQYDYISDGLTNLVVRNASNDDNYALNNILYSAVSHKYPSINTNDSAYKAVKGNVFVASNNTIPITLSMNTMYYPSKGHMLIRAGVLNGTYPYGKYSNSKSDTIDSIQFFTTDNKFLLPLRYNLPTVIDTYNEDTYQAKVKVTQPIFEQSKEMFYPSEGLTVKTKIPTVAKINSSSSAITIKDKDGNDLTSQVSLKKDSDGNISYMLPKSLLMTLKNNVITLEGTFDLDTSAKVIDEYTTNGVAILPISAQNSDNGTIVSEGEAKVKIPAPTGDPIAQTVYQGTSTKDLNANELVKNLKSTLSDDSLVTSFKEEKVFSTLGADTVLVEIRSELTGAATTISVPMTVVEKAKDNALLVWQPSIAGSKNKLQNVDKSTMDDTLEQKVAWWTSIPDRNYILSVRDINGNEVTSKELETNGSNVDTKIDVSFDMPTSQLNYGNNAYVVGIYVKDNAGKATGNPLDTINLTIDMSGSLKLVSVPNELKWTDRLSSKGILSRDKGNEMAIKVVDTRNIPEKNKTWAISAESQTMDNSEVPFDLQWKKDSSSEPITLSGKQITLTKSNAIKSGDNYTKNWNESEGIMLYSADYLKVGNYSNKVKVVWKIYDTATAE